MRALPSLLVLFVGCGGGGIGNATADLAIGVDAGIPTDLSPDLVSTACMPPDLAGLPPVTDMAQGGGDIAACQTSCSAKAKPGSATKWTAAFQCGQSYCDPSTATDMAGAKCIEVADPQNPTNHALCDPGQTYAQCTAPASTPGVCATCLANARNLIWFDTSADPNNPGPPRGICPCGAAYPDCKGGAACATVMDACINDP